MDMTVKVFPVQNSKNLLATASVTLGGCFAVCGIQIRDGKNGTFVSMPQRKDAKGEYHDICFPTTAEMRQAINERFSASTSAQLSAAQCLAPCVTRRRSPAESMRAIRAEAWRHADAAND